MVPFWRLLQLLLCSFLLSHLTFNVNAQAACDIYNEHYTCPNDTRMEAKDEPTCEEDLVGATLSLMERGDAEIELSEGEEAVMLIGSTGTGKSTLTYFLAGDNSRMISYKKSTGTYLIKDCNGKISVNSTLVSATIFPDLVVEPLTNTSYYDNPGFQDSRATCVEIANAYFMMKIARHIKKVKLVMVINQISIVPGQDRSDFTNLLKSVISFLPSVEKFGDALGLMATKLKFDVGEVSEDPYVSDAKKFITENRPGLAEIFTDPDDLRKATFIADTLATSSVNKIGMFRTPTDCGPLSDLENMQENKKHMSKIVMDNLNFVSSIPSDFGYSLSAEAKVVILTIGRQLNGETIDLIDKFGRAIYNYLLFQFNCTPTHDCAPVVNDLRVVFSNPDFSTQYEDTEEWLALTLTAVVDRIVNDNYLPLGLTTSPEILEGLQKNSRYLTFLGDLENLDISVLYWLQPLITMNNDLRNQVTGLIGSIDQTIGDILRQLSSKLQSSLKTRMDYFVFGNGVNDTYLQLTLSHLVHSSYDLIENEVGLNVTVYMDEIIKNVQGFDEGLANTSIPILTEYAAQLDFLRSICGDKTVSINPKLWIVPLMELRDNVRNHVVDKCIPMLNDNVTDLITRLSVIIQGHYVNKIGITPNNTQLYTLMDSLNEHYKILFLMQSTLFQTEARPDYLFHLENDTIEKLNITASMPFFNTIYEVDGRLKFFEQILLTSVPALSIPWTNPIKEKNVQYLENALFTIASVNLNSLIQTQMEDSGSEIGQLLRKKYYEGGYTSLVQLDLDADLTNFKDGATDLSNLQSLTKFSENLLKLCESISVNLDGIVIHRFPANGLLLDPPTGSPYNITGKWVAPLHVLTQWLQLERVKLTSKPNNAEIHSPRENGWGDWGDWDDCPTGFFVHGMQLKAESSTDGDDDTALNTIKFFCSPPGTPSDATSDTIWSRDGPFGWWRGVKHCPGMNKAIGFRLRSEPNLRGSLSSVKGVRLENDDTAGNNLRLICENGDVIEGDGENWGEYTAEQKCEPGQVMCGIRTQVEGSQGPGHEDDTALNNIDAHCCNVLS